MTDARTVIAGVRVFSAHDGKAVHTQPLGPHVANDVITALRAAGFRIVPEAPTDAMYNAYYERHFYAGMEVRDMFTERYKAMIGAADEQ